MNPTDQPPAWLDRTLSLLLSPRDRETIPGDLREAFRDSKLPHLGRVGANLWYARQVLSFVPRHLQAVAKQTPALALLCLFTALCGAWLGAAPFLLGRSPSTEGEFIAAAIVAQALLTLTALSFRPILALHISALAGCLGLLYLAAKALRGTLRGDHFEGYILLIALALTLQAALTLRALTRNPPQLTFH